VTGDLRTSQPHRNHGARVVPACNRFWGQSGGAAAGAGLPFLGAMFEEPVCSVQLRERKNGFLAPKRHQIKHLEF